MCTSPAVGGGFFTGRYNKPDEGVEPGSRFDPNKGQGQNYRKRYEYSIPFLIAVDRPNLAACRYWNEPYFKALEIIKQAADKAGLTMAEVALRWISHHSLMKREHGDAVLIGASSLNHIEQVRTTFISNWYD